MSYRRILCAVDFSEGSRAAMRLAVGLAKASDAALVLSHVWHLPPFAAGGEYPIAPETVQFLVDEASALLAEAGRAAADLGATHVTTALLRGVPWAEIVSAVGGEPPIDLVVMGTQGRTGVGRFLLGSVAEQVVRHAPCDVLVTRATAAAAPFAHVLCPVDFSDSSRRAADRAVQLAAKGGHGVVLLHVVETPATYSTRMDVTPDADMEATAARVLERWADELRAKSAAPVVANLRVGKAGAEILAMLGTDAFDLCVTGSHGRTGIRRVLLGSVAEKVVRHAPCAVLVARG